MKDEIKKYQIIFKEEDQSIIKYLREMPLKSPSGRKASLGDRIMHILSKHYHYRKKAKSIYLRLLAANTQINLIQDENQKEILLEMLSHLEAIKELSEANPLIYEIYQDSLSADDQVVTSSLSNNPTVTPDASSPKSGVDLSGDIGMMFASQDN